MVISELLDDPAIDPHGGLAVSSPPPAGIGSMGNPSDRRQEVTIRILGVEPGLDRRTGHPHVSLGQKPKAPRRRGDPDHLGHEVEPGDQLGHRVLDLQARVHLEEVEASIRPHDELDGPGQIVADRARARATACAPISARGARRRPPATAPPRRSSGLPARCSRRIRARRDG